MTQLVLDTECYVTDYWQYTAGGTSGTLSSGDKCTRCALSMALSYLGLDYTPGYMSTLYGSSDIPSPLVDVPNLIPSIERVDDEFDVLFNNYASDSDYSPIVMYFDYKHPDDGEIHSHAILIVGKNGDTYYAVDSAANATKLVEFSFNEDQTAIETCSYARYADTSAVQSFRQWKLNGTTDTDTRVYTIMYDWGDYVDGVVQTKKYDTKQHGVDYTISTEVPTYGSYVFRGWALDTDLTTPVYQPGDTYTSNADVVFYAVWGEPGSNPDPTQTYTITYDYNNGSGTTVTQDKTAGVDITLSVYDPTYEGYIFLGWALGDALDTVVYRTGDTYSEDVDLYLYAVWEAEEVERNIIAEGTCGTSLTWALDDEGLLTIDGTGAMTGYGSGAAPWYSYKTQILSLRVGEGVTTIGDYAFDGCTYLGSITLNEGLTTIGQYAFQNCDVLKSITIPDTVTTINYSAFYNCNLLEEVHFGTGLKTLGEGAFRECPKLTTITIPDALTGIAASSGSSGSFYGSPFSIVNVPSTVTSIPAALYNHSSIAEFVCEDSEYVGGNGYFDDDGILYKKNIYTEAQSLVKCPNSKAVKNYTVLDGTTSIGAHAFQYKTTLTSLEIPGSVTTIGDYAFDGCTYLGSITLNEGLTTIGQYAFQNCDVLKSITIPDTVTKINYYAFGYCDLLESAYFYGNAPAVDSYIFRYTASGFTVYYIEDTTGWSNPWNGYTTATFVPEDTTVSVTGVKLNKSTATMTVGSTLTLTATVTPSDATDPSVTWTSSNTAVAKVSGGKVTAVSAGTAVITATTTDGGYTASCTVTVEAAEVEIPEDAPVVTVANVTGRAGNTADVTISIENNTGITGAIFRVNYDSALTLTNVVTGDAFASLTMADLAVPYLNPLVLSWDGDGNDTSNGTLVTLTFTIPEGMEAGDYPIVIAYDTDDIYDSDLNDVAIAVVNGQITVTDIVYGDYNNDGKINGKDLTLIRRYISGGFDLSGYDAAAADVNLDGKVNGKDLTLIRRYISGGFDIVLGQ